MISVFVRLSCQKDYRRISTAQYLTQLLSNAGTAKFNFKIPVHLAQFLIPALSSGILFMDTVLLAYMFIQKNHRIWR